MKILVADDHLLVLDGLKILISTLDFVDEVFIASNYAEIKESLSKDTFEILFLDIYFGKYDGRQIISEIKSGYPNLKVIALTSHNDLATIKTSMNADFDGYLLKIDGRAEIEDAIKTVMNGKKYYSPKTQQLFFQKEMPKNYPELTQRELEVLRLIVQEKTTKEIADILHLSEKTIEAHRGSMMLKLEVRNIAGIVRKAFMLGLVNV